MSRIAFGPVPSRRLGRSLGINAMPTKSCTYACRYCQVGPTPRPEIEPHAVDSTEKVVEAVATRLDRLKARDEAVDILTIVPDGEPTLDVHLGETILALRELGLRIAVITNGSLLSREEVRARLRLADWVSVKVDAATNDVWRRVNRPHPSLSLAAIHEGRLAFASSFDGELVTETMLVRDVNDADAELELTAQRVADLTPQRAYLSVPTRPAAAVDIRSPSEATLARVFTRFRRYVQDVELLTGYEGDDFGTTGDPEADLLAATAVHPMRESQVRALLARSGSERALVERLVADGRLRRVNVPGEDDTFYMRPIVEA